MAKTRMATRPPTRAASRQNPTRPVRASLARSSKPTKSLNVDKSSDDSASGNDSDSDVLSVRDASDNDSADSGIDPDDDLEPSKSSRKRKRKAPATPKPRTRTPRKALRSSKKSTPRVRAKTSTPKSSTRTPKQKSQSQSPIKTRRDAVPEITNDIIPNWRDARIPYQAWVDIFFYASENGSETGWLLHASTTCRAFFEPAMAALYQSPRPRNLTKIKKLVALLETPPALTLLDYQSKIKALFVNIQTFPLGVIHNVVRPLHRMRELIIYTPLDEPPYRNLDKPIRWHYSKELFTALDPKVGAITANEGVGIENSNTSPILLRSWEWNSRLLGNYVWDIADISRVHQLPSFAGITRLGFTNFQLPSLNKVVKDDDEEGKEQLYQEDAQAIDSIADSISKLEHLTHLVFEVSQIMNERLLPQLPKGLTRLDLINCWEITSDDLASFLRTHGQGFQTLNLLHNQSLDLAFLPDLAETCPQLRNLRINMLYYRHHEYVCDSNPMYDEVLLPYQVPAWPASLHLVEIEHVRLGSVEAAEMFLQSFINSAPELPKLRHLTIKYGLDIPWQERANMRKKWDEKMTKVFLRRWTPPKRHTTLRPQLLEAAPALDPSSPSDKRGRPKKPKISEPSPPSRRSGRIAAHASDSDRGASKRPRNNGRPLYREPDTDEDEDGFTDDDDFFGSGDPGPKTEKQPDDEVKSDDGTAATEATFIHGLCETVNILFDNQKVREIQYGMEDFFDEDSESSGEEWNSNDEVEDESVFVWR
jgi:hypothetical protein